MARKTARLDAATFGPWALITGRSLVGAEPAKLAMPVDVCVADALNSLRANRAVRISGRMNRLMTAALPRSARTRLLGTFSKSMAQRAAPAANAGLPVTEQR